MAKPNCYWESSCHRAMYSASYSIPKRLLNGSERQQIKGCQAHSWHLRDSIRWDVAYRATNWKRCGGSLRQRSKATRMLS